MNPKKRSLNIRQLTVSAAAAALIFAVTCTLKIPVPLVAGGAYINLGDAVIYLTAALLGGPLAAAAAAIGSALADITVGATVYAAATFFIKGLMGLTVGLMSHGKSFARFVTACAAGGLIMAAGYGLYELAVFGAEYAFASLPFNLIQWAGGVAAAAALYHAVMRLKIPRFWER